MTFVISTEVRNERSGEISLFPSFRKEGLGEVLYVHFQQLSRNIQRTYAQFRIVDSLLATHRFETKRYLP